MENKRLGIFIENYLAGGCDKIARDFIDNLEYEKLYLFLNKDSNRKIILEKKLPVNVDLVEYKGISIHLLGSKANSFKGKNNYVYFFLKLFNLLARYPILLVNFLYFIFLFRKYKIDVFISNNGGYPGGEFNRMATLAYSFFHGKNFHLVHNLATKPFFKFYKPIEFFLDWLLDKRCQFICVSNQTKEYLLKNRYIKSNPIVIYNGVDQPVKIRNKKKDNKIRLLNVGLLGERKNQLMIIDAFLDLKEMGYKNIELFLLGDEEDFGYKEILNKKIIENKLDGVNIEGFVNPYEYYSFCDLFLLSSKVESFALVRVEAMSMGMPVITTDVGDASMQVKNSVNGFIISDGKEMSMAIKKYLDNPKLIDEHSKNGIDIFVSSFTIEKMISKYQKLVDGE
ncbi:hypothetical protein CRV08_06100 [Halarcobacter ebronensis]|uniref:Glycosyl transferase family 1 domain-containing protein n=1 Tax=Halarcobacter ebronensis TaxID=1462615 RepID=A0A4Q0YJB5_9BACT|nr:glycosyltransferase family 4 protein [Halarcobacter ebronensis]RXJ69001.1 hypothetical protein CRV08_06100 [Halarcobacter ebronensis]